METSQAVGLASRTTPSRPRIIPVSAAVAFLAAFGLTFALGCLLLQSIIDARKAEAFELAQKHADSFQSRLQDSIGAAYMLAGVVIENGGQMSHFDAVAADILDQFPAAAAVQLAPGGIIRQIYPLKGNEGALGHDLLASKDRRLDAHQALVKRGLTMAGPFDLVQGGVGAVARYPVFIRDAQGRQKFWGFSIVLFHVPHLLELAGVGDLSRAGYRYEFCSMQADQSGCKVFARRGEGPPEAPVSRDVAVPNGKWVLSIAPEGGWSNGFESAAVFAASFLLALLAGAAQYFAMARLVSRKAGA